MVTPSRTTRSAALTASYDTGHSEAMLTPQRPSKADNHMALLSPEKASKARETMQHVTHDAKEGLQTLGHKIHDLFSHGHAEGAPPPGAGVTDFLLGSSKMVQTNVVAPGVSRTSPRGASTSTLASTTLQANAAQTSRLFAAAATGTPLTTPVPSSAPRSSSEGTRYTSVYSSIAATKTITTTTYRTQYQNVLGAAAPALSAPQRSVPAQLQLGTPTTVAATPMVAATSTVAASPVELVGAAAQQAEQQLSSTHEAKESTMQHLTHEAKDGLHNLGHKIQDLFSHAHKDKASPSLAPTSFPASPAAASTLTDVQTPTVRTPSVQTVQTPFVQTPASAQTGLLSQPGALITPSVNGVEAGVAVRYDSPIVAVNGQQASPTYTIGRNIQQALQSVDPDFQDHHELRKDHNSGWIHEIVLALWPHIARFVGAMVKKSVEEMSEQINQEAPLTLDKEVKDLIAHLSAHPFSLPPKRTWANSVVDDIWKLLRPTVEKLVQQVLLPMIQKKLPSMLQGISIDPCDIGMTAPVVTKLEAHQADRSMEEDVGDLIMLTLKLEWDGDCNISINAPMNVVSVGVKGFKFETELKIQLVDLLDAPPFVGGINVWMVEPPTFKMDWTGMADFLDNNMIEEMIRTQVNQAVGKVLVLPNRVGIPINKDLDKLFKIKCPSPMGMLSVRMVRATGVRGDEVHMSTLMTGRRASDPYARAQIGEQVWMSKTIKDVTNGTPEWHETGHFLVHEPFDQLLELSLFDEDKLSGDDILGTLDPISILDLLGVPSDAPCEKLFQLIERKHTFKMKVENFNHLHELRMEQDALAKEHEKQHTGLMDRIQDAARGAMYAAAENIVHAGDGTHNGQMNTCLELEVMWRPFDTNEAVARSLVPKQEPTCLLFVGVLGCRKLPHPRNNPEADMNTTYWARVSLDPCRPVQRGDKDDPCATKKLKRPPLVDEGAGVSDKLEDEVVKRKVNLLVRNSVPIDVIAQVCDLSVKQVQACIDKNSSSTNEEVNVKWEDGFFFLLDDPKTPKVTIEVYKSVPRKKDQLVGCFDYAVDQLLRCDRLQDWQKGRPLVGGDPDLLARTTISTYLELRTVFNGHMYASHGHSALNRNFKPKVRGGIASITQEQKKLVFLDKMGREKVQIDGVWVEEDTDDEADAHKEGKAKGILGKVHDKVHDFFEKHHAHDAGAATAAQQPGEAAVHKEEEAKHKGFMQKAHGFWESHHPGHGKPAEDGAPAAGDHAEQPVQPQSTVNAIKKAPIVLQSGGALAHPAGFAASSTHAALPSGSVAQPVANATTSTMSVATDASDKRKDTMLHKVGTFLSGKCCGQEPLKSSVATAIAAQPSQAPPMVKTLTPVCVASSSVAAQPMVTQQVSTSPSKHSRTAPISPSGGDVTRHRFKCPQEKRLAQSKTKRQQTGFD